MSQRCVEIRDIATDIYVFLEGTFHSKRMDEYAIKHHTTRECENPPSAFSQEI